MIKLSQRGRQPFLYMANNWFSSHKCINCNLWYKQRRQFASSPNKSGFSKTKNVLITPWRHSGTSYDQNLRLYTSTLRAGKYYTSSQEHLSTWRTNPSDVARRITLWTRPHIQLLSESLHFQLCSESLYHLMGNHRIRNDNQLGFLLLSNTPTLVDTFVFSLCISPNLKDFEFTCKWGSFDRRCIK